VKTESPSGFSYGMNTSIRLLFRPAALLKRAIAFLLLLSAAQYAHAIQINITSGGSGWTYNVPTNRLPTVPGANMTTTTYASGTAQTVLSITQNPGGWKSGGTGWIISVSKTNVNWNSNLTLNIRRRGNGTPAGRLVGSTAYFAVPDNPTTAELVRCNTQTAVSAINCQFQILNVTVVVGTTNQAMVYYTVTEF
jgi:hypothetical protein